MSNKNKATQQQEIRKIVSAIPRYLHDPIVIDGVKHTPAELAKVFQDGIDLADATDAAEKQWRAAVAAERAKMKELSSIQARLRGYVALTYGSASTELADFGFAPKTPKAVDATTKAEAVKKRAATRALRHTMGKRQRQEIKGGTPSEVPPPPTTTTSPSNGASPPGAASHGP
jgi:hypothetical protein